MRRPGVGLARRVGFRGVGGSVASAPPFPSGYSWRLLGAGITEASGDVAAWDTDGGTALRFAGPSALERPARVTVGAVYGAQSTSAQDYLLSYDSDGVTPKTDQIVKPSIIWWCGRIDTWAASERLIDFDTNAYLATFLNGGTQTVRWEHGATDPTGTTAIASGDIVSVVVKVAASGGTSRIFIDGTEGTNTGGTATAPAARVVGIGGSNAGAGKANATHLGAAKWAFASNVAMDAFDLAALHLYGAWLVAQAGG